MFSCMCGRSLKSSQALFDHQRSTRHGYCKHCNGSFTSSDSLDQHRSALHHHECGVCHRILPSINSLRDHRHSTGHLYCCEPCKRTFGSQESLDQHNAAVHKIRCETCEQDFNLVESLQDHQRATNHCFCQACDRYFVSPEALTQHTQSSVHVSQYRCCDCEHDFADQQALKWHLELGVHEVSHTCGKCSRTFKDQKALDQHLASLIHNPLSNIKCIASSKCKSRFLSPSALLHHLESGGCCSGMTRKKLNRMVQKNDGDRLISSGIEENDLSDLCRRLDSVSISSRPMATPLSSGSSTPILTPMTDETSGVSLGPFLQRTPSELSSVFFNPQSYPDLTSSKFPPDAKGLMCPLCPGKNKTFATTTALQAHLVSPAHAPKAFHCPSNILTLGKGVGNSEVSPKLFSTLSGLTQHIESGACYGGKATFQKAIELVEERLKQMGFDQVRLLK